MMAEINIHMIWQNTALCCTLADLFTADGEIDRVLSLENTLDVPRNIQVSIL